MEYSTEKMYPIDAVVLAGKSKLNVDCKLETEKNIPTDYKSIVKLNGRPIVNYVMERLAESVYIKDIYVVGEKDKLDNIDFVKGKEKINFVDDQGSLLDNLVEGGNKAKTKKILFSMSDIPLIKTKDVDSFIQECLIKWDGSIYITYCTKKLNHQNLKENYPAKLKGEHLRNGSILMLDEDLLNVLKSKGELYNTVKGLYGKRKKGLWPYFKLKEYVPIKVLPLYAINLIFNNLGVNRLERLISNRATESIKKETGKNHNFNFYGIESPCEFADDVDSVKDLIKFEEHLKETLI
ncbi:MAG: NTP transferase domain-containing protein [Candidatus Nanoarchaeia archaeon]|nr:NTP transferase domain-containing protein [Candidatus Nanoarchaeia archaeon]